MPHRAITCTLPHTGLSLPVIVLAFAVFKTHQLVRHEEVEYGPYPHRSVKTIYSDAMEIQGTGNKVMTLLVHRVFSLSTQREQNTVGVAGVRIRRMKYKRPPVANTFAARGNLRHVSHHQQGGTSSRPIVAGSYVLLACPKAGGNSLLLARATAAGGSLAAPAPAARPRAALSCSPDPLPRAARSCPPAPLPRTVRSWLLR